MILSNTAIFEALAEGRLVITTEPGPRPIVGGPPSPYGTSAVDLRLGPTLLIPDPGDNVIVDLRKGDVAKTLTRLSIQKTIDPEQGWRLDPNTFILGQTLEKVALPLPGEFKPEANGKSGLAARVEGKSSRARFGLLIHFTAPTIHAGWEGPITLEIMNLGPAPIMLYPGMPICQLILEEVAGEPLTNPSQFQGQITPAG